MACVPSDRPPPAGDSSCGTGSAATGLGFDNLFRGDDRVSSIDSYLCLVRKVTTQGTGSSLTATHEEGWD